MSAAILRWLGLAPLSIIISLVAKLLAPILPAFASRDGWLPSWLWWFQTPDNPLDGDNGWKSGHWLWAYHLPPVISTYVRRVGWLLRNSAYGFDAFAGFDGKPTAALRAWGNVKAADAVPGLYFKVLANPDGSTAWQLFAMWHYSSRMGVRLNLGWKLWGWNPQEGNLCSLVISFNPFKGW